MTAHPSAESLLGKNIAAWLKDHWSWSGSAIRLAGDGSTRQFFRISGVGKSAILLLDPTWTSSADYPVLQHSLEEVGVPVPKFYAWDPKLGVLLMQDLGDTLLQSHLEHSPSDRMALLQEAIVLLARIHGRTYPVNRSLPVASRAFDVEKYTAELEFTSQHLLSGVLGLSNPMHSKKFCAHLAQFKPHVFCHRDYHCRNILFFEGGLYLIDFQDARMGAPAYDLASFIYDPYQQLQDDERAQLLGEYRKEISQTPLAKHMEWPHLQNHVDWVAIQRLIKAAGSFASFYTRFQKNAHLKYIEPALESANLIQNRLMSEMKKLGIEPFPITEWLDAWSTIQKTKHNLFGNP